MNDIIKIDNLIGDCMSELMDHLMQDNIHSPHLKNVKKNLIEIRQLITKNVIASSEFNLPINHQQTGQIIQRDVGIIGDKTECLKIAYALSRYDYVFFNKMFGLQLNQTEVFEMIGAIINVKPSTLRNYRDAFDSHVEQEYCKKKRKGWNKPLSQDLQFTKETCSIYSEYDLSKEIFETIKKQYPNIDLIVKVAFGFIFEKKGIGTEYFTRYNGRIIKAVVASHTDKIAYMVFLDGGNTLQNGFYPGIYMFRKYSKVFTVYGESNEKKWPMLIKREKIKDCLSTEEIEETGMLSSNFLETGIEKKYEINKDEVDKGYYKFKFANYIVEGLENIFVEFENDCPNHDYWFYESTGNPDLAQKLSSLL